MLVRSHDSVPMCSSRGPALSTCSELRPRSREKLFSYLHLQVLWTGRWGASANNASFIRNHCRCDYESRTKHDVNYKLQLQLQKLTPTREKLQSCHSLWSCSACRREPVVRSSRMPGTLQRLPYGKDTCSHGQAQLC